jgi:hypothetical protein
VAGDAARVGLGRPDTVLLALASPLVVVPLLFGAPLRYRARRAGVAAPNRVLSVEAVAGATTSTDENAERSRHQAVTRP